MSSRTTVERWFFYQDTANLWKWARLDLVGNVLDHSGAAFGTREECVDHARRCGYRAERAYGETPDVTTGRRATDRAGARC
jgi:hypothetical protein